jgi:GNAT superfamily N-acetyltransferase
MSDLLRLPPDEAMKPLITGLAVGDDPGFVRQLIKKSREPAILKYTPKDAARRFGDADMFAAWQAKGREVHWLLGEGDDLAGIIWYGASDFPLKDLELPQTPGETFAIRLYEGYAGHHLARPFMALSLKAHLQLKRKRGEPVTGIWLQTDTTNPAAIAAYTKFGYREVARDEKRVTMILDGGQMERYA